MSYLLYQFFMDLQCIIGSHDMVIIIDLQCIGLQLWLVWIESITGPMLVMSLSLFASLLDGYLANYFTYHFLLASYFGGNFVALGNYTLPIILHGNSPFPFQPPRKPNLSHLGHIFSTSWRVGAFLLFTQSVDGASHCGLKSTDAIFLWQNPRSVLMTFLLGASMVKK